ncbi:hypothetical protein T440DRAFT_313612 [Plenodomus tracheiphilus IPT5]|uniref:SP-RING-type domain-containing protein n=1 Tax=Plenodomus tracheiphilus IPT5 TaxID=1408161 RepID=A0A6A7BDQ3_9PLEO|nr:hypothetical protein T440DRAFT_313612 [Plenodomus tracheiphilus IPT5]
MTTSRRPAASSADVQNTLHYALGNLGGRQKSWMATPSTLPSGTPSTQTPTATHLPVQPRRRGRPTKDALHAPSDATPHAQAAPSSSISPQLASVVSRNHCHGPGHAHAAVFPSPAPSEETAATLPTPPHHEPARGCSTHLDFLGARQPHAAHGADALQPQTQPIDMRLQHQTPAQAQSNTTPTHTSAPASNTSFENPRSVPSPLDGQGTTPQHQAQPMTVGTAWYTAQDCWEALHRFKAAFPPSSGHPCDEGRLAVLRDAVQQQDWHYLTLHQYYCLHTLDRNALPKPLRSQPKLPQAMLFLREVLGSNSRVSHVYLQFFVNFPAPIQVLGAYFPAMFEQQGHQLLLFITRSPDYKSLKHSSDQRRFPPLAGEMIFDYKIASVTLQRLLFTSCLRWISRDLPKNPHQPRYETNALAVFEQNRAALYQHQLALQQTQQQGPFEELIPFGQALRKLLADHEATLHRYLSSLALQHPGAHPSRLPSQPAQYQAYLHSGVAVAAPTPQPNDRLGEQQPTQATMQQRRARERLPDRLVLHSNVSMPSLPRRPPLRSNASIQSWPHLMQIQQQTVARIPLLPPLGWTQPQQRVPNPARFGLHQAHLRSPTQTAKSSPSPLYCFVHGFLQQPVRLSEATRAIETLSFSMTSAEVSTIARQSTKNPGHYTRIITEASKIIRLRCVKWPGAEMPRLREWAIADTAWIPYSYFTFNNTSLEQRRKVHYGKDQPIDLTHLVREGVNTVQATIMAATSDTAHTNYLVAVEILGIQSHKSIKEQCLTARRIPASDILTAIKTKLSGTNEDDEMAIVASNLSISLFDPFSASSICAIPVRSKACAHFDCFDLETFLSTRPRSGDVSRADTWRCPICNADARPSQLIVDGFLEEVKGELESNGLEMTRVIVVGADGTWKPRTEVREGVSDKTPPPEAQKAMKEVIDLSD